MVEEEALILQPLHQETPTITTTIQDLTQEIIPTTLQQDLAAIIIVIRNNNQLGYNRPEVQNLQGLNLPLHEATLLAHQEAVEDLEAAATAVAVAEEDPAVAEEEDNHFLKYKYLCFCNYSHRYFFELK